MTINKVQFLRRGFGLTAEYVSNKLGISRPTLAKKESGSIDFTRKEMITITEMMQEYDPNITVEKIFFNNDFSICEFLDKGVI